jgi:thiamine-monophosphate kinase
MRAPIAFERSAHGAQGLERGNQAISDVEIHAFLGRLADRRRGVELGVGHDAAVVRAGGARIALKVDPTIEGVHFERGFRDARAIARKALNRPASDLAAVGAEPRWALISIELPPVGRRFAGSLLRELDRAARGLGAAVVGGHTGLRGARRLAIHVTLAGECSGRPRGRSGARAGDRILVTGSFGGSILGKHLAFRPRLAESRALRAIPIHAAIDVTDGLALDLARVAQASGVGARVDAASIPISLNARKLARGSGLSALDHALGDGEDYELLFAVPSRGVSRAIAAARRHRFRLTEIGRFQTARRFEIRDASGALRILEPSGYVQRSNSLRSATQ